MSQAKTNPMPLPAAVLALSVAVCIGSAGAAGAAPMLIERATQAEHRQTIEHLLDAIQQAARRLTDRLSSPAVIAERQAILPQHALRIKPFLSAGLDAPGPTPLRDALLNLPPPAC